MTNSETVKELIETLWNVNYARLYLGYLLSLELIETLWNVNPEVLRELEEMVDRINRNIVECKLD